MLVMDMDWHITFYKEARQGKKGNVIFVFIWNVYWPDLLRADQANQTIGWTGYTFDPHLFPNPSAFLAWLNDKGIHATMNLHPASGVQPWEEFYPNMVCIKYYLTMYIFLTHHRLMLWVSIRTLRSTYRSTLPTNSSRQTWWILCWDPSKRWVFGSGG